MAGQQPKWKLDNAVAVWDFGDRISIRLFNWDYITVPLNKDKDKPIPRKEELVQKRAKINTSIVSNLK
tara:strand:+ start:2355 stop:2558 length:204 start_codon:yes stop_codon:yes gene_type:complete